MGQAVTVSIFIEEIVDLILQTKPIVEGTRNYIPWWMGSTNGQFTIRSVQDIIRYKNEQRRDYEFIWHKGLHFKYNFFLWMVWMRRIHTDNNLKRMRIQLVSRCWYCEARMIKCNTEGAFRENPGLSAYGFCIRDDKGDLIYARAKGLGLGKNTVAESITIKGALKYYFENDFKNFIRETDSLSLKQ